MARVPTGVAIIGVIPGVKPLAVRGVDATPISFAPGEKRRRRWDQTAPADDNDPKAKKIAYDE
ncbi:unnamed protein product, partial [Rotaria sp. Silwood1]